MNLLVGYGGRFQPFHRGHFATYMALVRKFGIQNIYIVTSNATGPESPFNFDEKKQIINEFNITQIIQSSKSPLFLSAHDLEANGFDPSKTIYISAIGVKDKDRFSTTPNVSEYNPNTTLQPFSQHRYWIAINEGTNTGISATNIRNIFMHGSLLEKETCMKIQYHSTKLMELFNRHF